MIIEKNIKKDFSFELPSVLLEKARLWGRVNVIVDENEITIKKISAESAVTEKMTGLGKGIFDKDAVALQKELREEWKL